MLDLVNIRASAINGCAFCTDMHVKEAKIHGERELRLYHVPIWRESTLFDARERAALEWTEIVTRLPEGDIPDEVYRRVREQFSEKELSDLTFAIGTINLWNRLNVSFRTPPGSADALLGLTNGGTLLRVRLLGERRRARARLQEIRVAAFPGDAEALGPGNGPGSL